MEGGRPVDRRRRRARRRRRRGRRWPGGDQRGTGRGPGRKEIAWRGTSRLRPPPIPERERRHGHHRVFAEQVRPGRQRRRPPRRPHSGPASAGCLRIRGRSDAGRGAHARTASWSARARWSALFTAGTVVSSSSATSRACQPSTSRKISTARWRPGRCCSAAEKRQGHALPGFVARFGVEGGPLINQGIGQRLQPDPVLATGAGQGSPGWPGRGARCSSAARRRRRPSVSSAALVAIL